MQFKVVVLVIAISLTNVFAQTNADKPIYGDVHLHPNAYHEKYEVDLASLAAVMEENNVKRAAVMPIPLNVFWDGKGPEPTYYAHLANVPLKYDTHEDHNYALQYQKLGEQEQSLIDLMITGFDPADGTSAAYIKKLVLDYPNAFVGIGEFSIMKEIVSAEIAGPKPTLDSPALASILNMAAEIGLVALIHNDIDAPIPGMPNFMEKDPNDPDDEHPDPTYLADIKTLFSAHPNATIIWAHTGLGRYVKPRPDHVREIDILLAENPHVSVDISWDIAVPDRVLASNEVAQQWIDLFFKYPTRIFYGSDKVAPKDGEAYAKTIAAHDPIWKLMRETGRDNAEEVIANIQYGNYVRVFDAAKEKIAQWTASNQ